MFIHTKGGWLNSMHCLFCHTHTHTHTVMGLVVWPYIEYHNLRHKAMQYALTHFPGVLEKAKAAWTFLKTVGQYSVLVQYLASYPGSSPFFYMGRSLGTRLSVPTLAPNQFLVKTEKRSVLGWLTLCLQQFITSNKALCEALPWQQKRVHITMHGSFPGPFEAPPRSQVHLRPHHLLRSI